MKIALIQDWLTESGGAEKVFKNILEIYPEADVHVLVYNEQLIKEMGIKAIKSTFIQNLPFAKTKYRNYLPLFTYAIESIDLSKYDLIISSSYSVAKGVLTNSNQLHICYCHSPVRYAWDLYHQYLKESNLQKGFKGLIVKYFLHKLRIWDIISSNRVDYFISNSNYIGKRIAKIYRRESKTIYPGVCIDDFDLIETKDDYYFTCSRLVPYKKVDLIVRAFSKLPNKKLIVIGDGPDRKKIEALLTENISYLGYQDFGTLKKYMSNAKAFVYAAEEDFGIVPVEAQACGTPVIAFGKGGSLETVKSGISGVFFYDQTEEALKNAVLEFEEKTFDAKLIRQSVEHFGVARFKKEFSEFVNSKINKKID